MRLRFIYFFHFHGAEWREPIPNPVQSAAKIAFPQTGSLISSQPTWPYTLQRLMENEDATLCNIIAVKTHMFAESSYIIHIRTTLNFHTAVGSSM